MFVMNSDVEPAENKAAMDVVDQVRISKCLKILSDNVMVDDIMPQLMSDLVITPNDRCVWDKIDKTLLTSNQHRKLWL